MNDFKEKVRSRWWRWLLWTTISGAILLLMNAGFIYIVTYYIGIEPDSFDLYTILFTTSVWVLISLVAGQAIHSMIQQTWGTWIANLDEHTLEILIATLINTFEKASGRKYTIKYDLRAK